MSTTPQLGLELIPEGTIDPSTALNLTLEQIDALASAGVVAVLSMALTAPPGSPVNGAQYIAASGSTGAWADLDGFLVRYVEEGDFWQDFEPGVRFKMVLNQATGTLYRWDGATYAPVTGGGATIEVSDGITTVAAADTLLVSGGAAVGNPGGGAAALYVTAPVIPLAGTAYTLGDLTPGAWHVFTAATPVTITVENDADDPLVAWAEFGLEARGNGGVLLVIDDIAEVIPPKGGTLELETGDFALLKRTAEDVYKLVGSTVEAAT